MQFQSKGSQLMSDPQNLELSCATFEPHLGVLITQDQGTKLSLTMSMIAAAAYDFSLF